MVVVVMGITHHQMAEVAEVAVLVITAELVGLPTIRVHLIFQVVAQALSRLAVLADPVEARVGMAEIAGVGLVEMVVVWVPQGAMAVMASTILVLVLVAQAVQQPKEILLLLGL